MLVTSTGTLNELNFVRGDERYTYTMLLADSWETNDGAMVRAWALAGHGIAHKSIWDIAVDVRSGVLRMVLPDWCTRSFTRTTTWLRACAVCWTIGLCASKRRPTNCSATRLFAQSDSAASSDAAGAIIITGSIPAKSGQISVEVRRTPSNPS